MFYAFHYELGLFIFLELSHEFASNLYIIIRLRRKIYIIIIITLIFLKKIKK